MFLASSSNSNINSLTTAFFSNTVKESMVDQLLTVFRNLWESFGKSKLFARCI